MRLRLVLLRALLLLHFVSSSARPLRNLSFSAYIIPLRGMSVSGGRSGVGVFSHLRRVPECRLVSTTHSQLLSLFLLLHVRGASRHKPVTPTCPPCLLVSLARIPAPYALEQRPNSPVSC